MPASLHAPATGAESDGGKGPKNYFPFVNVSFDFGGLYRRQIGRKLGIIFSLEFEMRKRNPNVQKLDVLVAKIRECLPGVPIHIEETRDVWKIKGWGFKGHWERVVIKLQLEGEGDDARQ